MTNRFSFDFWLERCQPAEPVYYDAPEFCAFEEQRKLARSESIEQSDWYEAPADERTLPARPDSVFIPERYEDNYPYPLLVWVHGSAGTDPHLTTLMNSLSEQNYLAISLRPGDGSGTWDDSPADLARFEQQLQSLVTQLRGSYNVHTERIFLAGFEDGANLALRMLLHRPQWFAGAAGFSGGLKQPTDIEGDTTELRAKKVLIAAGSHDRALPAADVVRTSRVLHAAGINVSTRFYDAAREVSPRMLREMNHWMMETVCAVV